MVKQLFKERKISGATESRRGSSKWAEFVKENKDDALYNDLVGQSYPYSHSGGGTSGSQPREIFEDVLNEEREVLKNLKPEFK